MKRGGRIPVDIIRSISVAVSTKMVISLFATKLCVHVGFKRIGLSKRTSQYHT